jgi:hypothetical protein
MKNVRDYPAFEMRYLSCGGESNGTEEEKEVKRGEK